MILTWIKLDSFSEALQTVVNEVVIRVFGNSELKKKIESKDEGTIDEGKNIFFICGNSDQA